MVSEISEWLQKKMPSYGTIESKITEKQLEDDKNTKPTLNLNIFLFVFLLLAIYVDTNFTHIFNNVMIAMLMVVAGISAISIICSIIFARQFNILKYKIYMFMVGIAIMPTYLFIFAVLILEEENVVVKLALIIILFISIKMVLLNNKVKIKSIDGVIKYGSIFCLVTGIYEQFFGKPDWSQSMDSIVVSVLMIIMLKYAVTMLAPYYRTLFYILAYPEQFRKKFGYSVNDWYGKHSSQYREKKEFI